MEEFGHRVLSICLRLPRAPQVPHWSMIIFMFNIVLINRIIMSGYSRQLCDITSCFGLHSHQLLLYQNSLGSLRCQIVHFQGGGQVSIFCHFWGTNVNSSFKIKAIFFSDLSTLQWLILAVFKTFQLAPYCLGPKETLDEFSEDPDRLLLSSIAEKVAQPIWRICISSDFWLKVMVAKLVTIVRSGYDPVSTNQTQRLVGCMQRTLQDFPSITPRWVHIAK